VPGRDRRETATEGRVIDANDASVKQYLELMTRYLPNADPGDVSTVFGYTAAGALVEVLGACGDDLSRENVMRQAASLKHVQLPMLLSGIEVTTDPTDFRPISQMQLARFDGQRFVRFGKPLDGD
jgi:branched-chain amino acid transport system substrate-binding protein